MHKWKRFSILMLSFMILYLCVSPVVAQRQTETVNEYYDYSDSSGYLCTVRVSLNGFPTIENRKETYTATLIVQNIASDVEIILEEIFWEVKTAEGFEKGSEEIDVSLTDIGDSYEFQFNVKSISDKYEGDATLAAKFKHDIYREDYKKRDNDISSISADLQVFAVEQSPSPTNPSNGNSLSGDILPSFPTIVRLLPFVIVIILIIVVASIVRRRPRHERHTIPAMSEAQLDGMTYDELLGRREALEEGLRKIETQLNAGLLSPQQYMDAYTKYRSDWININRRLVDVGISESEIVTPPTIEEVACPSCGMPYPSDTPFCPNCGEELLKCTVCLLPIISGEIIKCRHCGGIAHKDHLQEWVKVKGFCPNCKNKLTEYDLIQ